MKEFLNLSPLNLFFLVSYFSPYSTQLTLIEVRKADFHLKSSLAGKLSKNQEWVLQLLLLFMLVDDTYHCQCLMSRQWLCAAAVKSTKNFTSSRAASAPQEAETLDCRAYNIIQNPGWSRFDSSDKSTKKPSLKLSQLAAANSTRLSTLQVVSCFLSLNFTSPHLKPTQNMSGYLKKWQIEAGVSV